MIQEDNAPSIMLHKKLGFFMDRRQVALLDLRDPKLRLRWHNRQYPRTGHHTD
jgi:aminoglycoside 6'-N-acetyltransferase I